MSKTVLITGATSGFGKACADRFAQGKYNLILLARTKEKLIELKAQLDQITEVHIIPADVRDFSMLNEHIGSLPGNFSDIDILINNAGLALGSEPAHEGDLNDWEVMIDTNIKGLLYCTKLVLPKMVKRNDGHIVNIGSIAGNWVYPNINVYGGTKAFVRQFSLNLRADLSGTKVRVSLIEPGIGDTDFAVTRFKGDSVKADDLFNGLEALKPKDIADVIFWVASLPKHVNVNSIEVMPVCQTWGPMVLNKNDI